MRCSKKFCVEDAVDGSNYCQSHLKVSGAPRPGISNHRSASDGRILELTLGKERIAAKRAAKPPLKKANQNPVLLGKASSIAEAPAPAGKKTARKSSTGASRKPASMAPKTRGG